MDKYNFINKDAVGIWGWSYGNFRSKVYFDFNSI